MRTLFLKKIDFFAQLAPTTFNFSKPSTASRQKTCIIRPGGLGDLVVMTRACRDLGLALEDFDWIVECRNASWLKYLSIPYLRYDNAAELRQIIGRYGSYQRVIVSEQYHGLATILAQFLASRDGEVIGFESNPRAKVFSKKIAHNSNNNHELLHFSELLSSEKQVTQQSNNDLDLTNGTGKHVVLAFAGEYSKEKSLSPSQWKSLANYAQIYEKEICLVGNNSFRKVAKNIQQEIPNCNNLVATASFEEVVELIKNATRFIGIDSGLMHIADYFNVASDVIFLESAKAQWQPLSKGSKVVTSLDEL